jgi:UDP-glucose 4-epimerase
MVKAVYRLQHPGVGGVLVGSTEEVTICLAQRVLALTGSQSPIQLVPYEVAYTSGFEDMRRRLPSLAKINALIGYQPRCSLEESLSRVIAYERERLT